MLSFGPFPWHSNETGSQADPGVSLHINHVNSAACTGHNGEPWILAIGTLTTQS